MGQKYKLTIAVLTMNRADQLKEAVESCVLSVLPQSTQILVLDNASTDQTKEVVDALKETVSVPITYHKEDINRGVGGGRNILFDLAEGEYVYFLDDDAIIHPDCKDRFFVDAIQYLDENTNVASLTTQIEDEIFGLSRTTTTQSKKIGGRPISMLYCGGSHFLRKSCFSSPLYFELQYGSEEYLPAIRAINQGFYHVIDNEISIIHKPKVNKWVDGTERMRNVLIKGAANVYATKKLLYPIVFHPILKLGYLRRCQQYLSPYPSAKKESDAIVKQLVKTNKVKKIKIVTVIHMYRDFGLTVF